MQHILRVNFRYFLRILQVVWKVCKMRIKVLKIIVSTGNTFLLKIKPNVNV